MTKKEYDPPDWTARAAELQLSALLWQSLADQARHTDHGLGHLNTDYAASIARSYRDMARAAEFTADACKEIAYANALDATAAGAVVPCLGECPPGDAA